MDVGQYFQALKMGLEVEFTQGSCSKHALRICSVPGAGITDGVAEMDVESDCRDKGLVSLTRAQKGVTASVCSAPRDRWGRGGLRPALSPAEVVPCCPG